MMSPPGLVSNRKYSIKQVSHFPTLLVTNSHNLPPIKLSILNEIQ